ncbi:MAG TPA: PA-phosphatase [Mycobacterium sp.]|nr:PA-phosphatase [Mycobacterium sp.]
MTRAVPRRALLLWTGFAVAAMCVLGWAVGKQSTPIDDWFHGFGRSPAKEMLVFTDPWLLGLLLAAGVGVALRRRRWRLGVVIATAPLVAIVVARTLKSLFGREKDGSLAYPSGHTTVAVVVVGMIVLVAGARTWALVAAAVYVVLGMIGQGVTYHYFTDTVGALLLGSAVVCVAAAVAKLDTRQPACDVDHTCR